MLISSMLVVPRGSPLLKCWLCNGWASMTQQQWLGISSEVLKCEHMAMGCGVDHATWQPLTHIFSVPWRVMHRPVRCARSGTPRTLFLVCGGCPAQQWCAPLCVIGGACPWLVDYVEAWLLFGNLRCQGSLH